MSVMLLDAASIGASILCSDIPANVSALQQQALYFKSGDAQDLAEKLLWALDHPGEMQALGAQAQVWMRENSSWDRITERYDRLYREVARAV
jgi:glycosyltransferase involved in cell wall biosynthesis